MKIKMDEELRGIFQDILDQGKNHEDWALLESSDMFQTNHYCGGYDATEEAFCFSYYTEEGKEFWFQLSLEDMKKNLDSDNFFLVARDAE